jgi:hypothetical protein
LRGFVDSCGCSDCLIARFLASGPEFLVLAHHCCVII